MPFQSTASTARFVSLSSVSASCFPEDQSLDADPRLINWPFEASSDVFDDDPNRKQLPASRACTGRKTGLENDSIVKYTNPTVSGCRINAFCMAGISDLCGACIYTFGI